MRILVLAGAHSVHTIRWAAAFSRKGHEVHVVSTLDHQIDAQWARDAVDGVEFHHLPYRSLGGLGYFLNASACRKLSDELNADVVSAHYASGYGTLARIARLSPVVLSVWGSDVYSFPDRSAFHKKLVTANLRYANRIASTSEAMAGRVREILDEQHLPVTITPFGVDLDQYKQKAISSVASGKLRIGIVKSFRPIYGVGTLLEAVAIVNSRRETDDSIPLLHVHLYGDGPQRAELVRRATELQVEDNVTFHGKINNASVPAALAKLDIFAMPSLHESFGVAAVEAMAAGLAVIVSDAPGLQEIVAHGRTGLVFPAQDSNALADAVVKLARSPLMRRELGSAARAEVEKRFNFDKNTETLLSTLTSVAETK